MTNHVKAAIRLKLASDKQLTTILEALTPEAKAPATRRSSGKISKRQLVSFVNG